MPGTSHSARSRVDLVQRDTAAPSASRRRAARPARSDRSAPSRRRPSSCVFGNSVGRDAGGLVPHQLVARSGTAAADCSRARRRGTSFSNAAPLYDVLRQLLVVEREDQLVVDQHVLAARLVLELLDLARPACGCARRTARCVSNSPADQRVADEDLARARRVVLREVARAAGCRSTRPYSVARSSRRPAPPAFPSAARAATSSAGARRPARATRARSARCSARTGACLDQFGRHRPSLPGLLRRAPSPGQM